LALFLSDNNIQYSGIPFMKKLPFFHFFKHALLFLASTVLLTSVLLAADLKKTDTDLALDLLDQVDQALKAKLDRLDAPIAYRNAYQAFKSFETRLKEQISRRPLQVALILDSALRSLGLSHLTFYKLEKGSLGFEVEEMEGGKMRLTQVLPGSEAAALGLKAGDIVKSISDLPASQALSQGILQNSVSAKSKEKLTLIDDKIIQCQFINLLGVETENNNVSINNNIRIKDVTPNSPAAKLGLQAGDLIEILLAQPDSNSGINTIEALFKANVEVRIKERTVWLRSLDERCFTVGLWGFHPDYIPTDFIDWVYPNSPAENAGIKKGDLIISVDKKAPALVKCYRPGEKAEFRVQRKNGQIETLHLTAACAEEFRRPFFREIDFGNKNSLFPSRELIE
jgi:C-terminal processing protease CtpA/Prc